jgi:hypothetical protein
VHSKITTHSGARVLPAEPLDDPPETGASLIVISLLSLGLWAAIWGAVAAFASVVPG